RELSEQCLDPAGERQWQLHGENQVGAGMIPDSGFFTITRGAVATGDFDGDGKLDVALANEVSNKASILFNNTATGYILGVFCAKTDLNGGNFPESVALGDFNQDGQIDLAVANFNGNTVSIFLGTGNGSFGAKTDFATGTGPFAVALGDFNGDGRLDLVTANALSNNVSILLGAGNGSFGAQK